MYKSNFPHAKLNLAIVRTIPSALALTRYQSEYENIVDIRPRNHFLHYHEEGTLRISTMDGNDHHLIPGDTYFLFANTTYPSHKPTSEFYRSIKVFFEPHPADRLEFSKTPDGQNEVSIPWIIRTSGDPKIFNLFQELVSRNNASSDISLKESATILNMLLLQLTKITIKKPVLEQKISRIKEIVESKAMENISIDHLAEEVMMSRSALMGQFKRLTGTTIMKYHMELRMKSACHLITSDHGIGLKELASLLGFYDEFHFGRTFKSYLGMTVGQYKKRNLESISSADQLAQKRHPLIPG